MTKQDAERLIVLLRKQLTRVPSERTIILSKIRELEGKIK
jgi:hypothetical protein